MSVPLFLIMLEETGLSTWIRESKSLFGFYFALLMHDLGLALVVGASLFVGLRLRGVAPDLPLAPLKKFFTIFFAGVWISVVSGLFLLMAYPTKALTNPVFYVKLALIAAGVWIM